jgi:hypothetical protein
MQHAHVKRKEKPMNRYIMEEFYNDPAALRRRLSGEAHRERNRAIRAAFAWLRDRLTPRIRLRPSRWLARLG